MVDKIFAGHNIVGDKKTGPMVECVICKPNHTHKGVRYGWREQGADVQIPAVVTVSMSAYVSMTKMGALQDAAGKMMAVDDCRAGADLERDRPKFSDYELVDKETPATTALRRIRDQKNAETESRRDAAPRGRRRATV